MRHFSRAACKVSAIYAAPAAVHFPNLKWDLGRRYHLERPRHLGKYIFKGFAGYKMKITLFIKRWTNCIFRPAPHCVQHPRLAASGRPLERGKTHPRKSFSGLTCQKNNFFTIFHPLFPVSLVLNSMSPKNLDTVQNGLNVIDMIKGCAGRNSLQWSTTSWHGARQGGANEDKVGWGWKKIWQVDLQGVGEDSQLYSIWLQGAEPRTLPGLTWSNSIGLEVIC